MKIKDTIVEINEEVKKLNSSKTVSMSFDTYNKDIQNAKNQGMSLVMNIVFDIVNNKGENIKTDETTSKAVLDFIEFVKENVKKPTKKRSKKNG